MICNIAAYKFISLQDQFLIELKEELLSKMKHAMIKGTILLSSEGINLFVAGNDVSIKSFQELLHSFFYFQDMTYKYSYSEVIPFQKFVVKIRNEIITCGDKSIKPFEEKIPYVSPQIFKEWLDNNLDMLVLDTRNKFEFDIGHFNNAEHLNLEHFREFKNALDQISEDYKDKPIVTYCTGGIRCEKAGLILRNHGFKKVYQLEGGILNFFEQCGGNHYQGNCFVFDDRIAVNSELEPVE